MERDLHWVTEAVKGRLLESEQGPGQVDLALVVTDSREATEGSTYVARVGEQSDGHDYCAQAAQNGATCLIVERPVQVGAASQILVEDGTLALGQLAQAHLRSLRDEGDIAVIGITGSAGKTTTKDLLGFALSQFAPTVWPKLSYNNEVGCPITILKAQADTRYLVLEMGASAAGELDYLTDLAPLDVALVLMVGRAHLGGFGGTQELARAKAELVQGLVPTGIAVLNLDDPAISAMARYAPGRVFWFSVSGDAGADLWSQDVHFDELQRARFKLVDSKGSAEVRLGLVGEHQVSNALAAASVMVAIGLELGAVARALNGARASSPHRMDVKELSLQFEDGRERVVTLVDDSYNANPDSMAAAFVAARALAGKGRLLMVLGSMLELGDETDQIHAEVGAKALEAEPFAMVLLTGAERYLISADRGGDGELTAEVCASPVEALRVLEDHLEQGDTILVKGSNASGAWQVADALVDLSRNAAEGKTK